MQWNEASPTRYKTHRAIRPEKVLDLWWYGCGGILKSPQITCTARGTEPGVDYPYIVSLHIERFFEILPTDWRELAWWAAGNAYRLEYFPVWRVTNERILAMRCGQAVQVVPTMRGRVLFAHLKKMLMDWLAENPLPETTGWIEND